MPSIDILLTGSILSSALSPRPLPCPYFLFWELSKMACNGWTNWEREVPQTTSNKARINGGSRTAMHWHPHQMKRYAWLVVTWPWFLPAGHAPSGLLPHSRLAVCKLHFLFPVSSDLVFSVSSFYFALKLFFVH